MCDYRQARRTSFCKLGAINRRMDVREGLLRLVVILQKRRRVSVRRSSCLESSLFAPEISFKNSTASKAASETGKTYCNKPKRKRIGGHHGKEIHFFLIS